MNPVSARLRALAAAVVIGTAALPLPAAATADAVLERAAEPKRVYEKHHVLRIEAPEGSIQSVQKRHVEFLSESGGLVASFGLSRNKDGRIEGLLLATVQADKVQPFLELVKGDGKVLAQVSQLGTLAGETEMLDARLKSWVILRDKLRAALEGDALQGAERLRAEAMLTEAQIAVDEATTAIADLRLRRNLISVAVHYEPEPAPAAAPPPPPAPEPAFSLTGEKGPQWAGVLAVGFLGLVGVGHLGVALSRRPVRHAEAPRRDEAAGS